MKKLIKYVLFIAFILLMFSTKETRASTGSTVFIGEPIVLDSYENVEITLNDVEINEETSEVKNTHLFTNLSDKTITRKASVKLEDSFSNFTINSLKIIVNDYEIKEIEKEGDNYTFSFQIPPNEGKKIEIMYKTDNDLQNAKIIKYTMDSIKGKKVKLYKINVKFSKYDIPLVQKIWPGAYEFENNTVSTEYFDFKVNNLTSSFIIQKETYRNLKYGYDTDTYTEDDLYIIEHANKLIDEGVFIKYDLDNEFQSINYRETLGDIINKEEEDLELSWGTANEAVSAIYYYVLALQLEKDGKQYSTFYSDNDSFEYVNGKTVTTMDYSGGYCLVEQTVRRIDKDADFIFSYGGEYAKNLYGKTVAINYYETEGDRVLYVTKNDEGNYDEETGFMESRDVVRKEYTILRTINGGKHWDSENRGYKKVYVNSDIDGNKIDISEEEIIEFVNMMNVDLYLRLIVYDPGNSNVVYAGYYTDNSRKIASKYINEEENIESIEKRIEEYSTGTPNWMQYVDWEGMTLEEWKNNEIKDLKEKIEQVKSSYRKFDNETVSNNTKVPTLAHCVGYTSYQEGKWIVDFLNSGHKDGLGDIYEATECEVAKKMLVDNKANNEAIKNKIVNKMGNTNIKKDTEEYN